MKLKIIKCSNSEYWYADKIGQMFDVYDILQGTYRVKQGMGAYCVLNKDVELL